MQMVVVQANETLSHVLTAEGSQIAQEGSHEARVWAALPRKGQGKPLSPQQLKEIVGDDAAKVGQGRAFKNGWIGKEGGGLVQLVGSLIDSLWPHTILGCTQASAIGDATQKELQEVESTGTLKSGEKALADLRKRRLITQRYDSLANSSDTSHLQLWCRKGQWFAVHKGANFSTSTAKPETDLTADMIASYVQIRQDCLIPYLTHLQWDVEDIYLQEVQFRGRRHTHCGRCPTSSPQST
jgi:phenylalanyl-tRNA synthetase alpha chain